MSKEQLDRIEWKLDQIIASLLSKATADGVATPYSTPQAKSDGVQSDYLHSLTTKQHAALQMLLRGADNQEIADRMGVSINTAKVHVRGIAKKLGVSTRTQIIWRIQKEVMETEDNAYQMLTGGLPKDWDTNFTSPDPFVGLYGERKNEPKNQS